MTADAGTRWLPPGLRQLVALLADQLGTLADSTLALDPASSARLNTLEGSSVVLRARAPDRVFLPAGRLPDLEFTLAVRAGHLVLEQGAAPEADVVVAGSLADLMQWAGSRGRTTPQGLRIDGDTRLLEAIAGLGTHFQADLQTPLAHVVGNDVAGRLLDAADLAAAGLRTVLQTAGEGLRRQSGTWFSTLSAADTFLDELDDLRLAVDRLAARVTLVEQTRRQARPTR